MEALLAVGKSVLPANMNEKQCLFAIWLATPKKERRPETQKLLAYDLQVDEDTLTNWKSLPGFSQAVIEITKEDLLRAVPEILHRMKNDALQSNCSQSITDRVLELTGVWSRKQSVQHEHKFIFEDMLNEIIDSEEVGDS
jgi:hypothetical protein